MASTSAETSLIVLNLHRGRCLLKQLGILCILFMWASAWGAPEQGALSVHQAERSLVVERFVLDGLQSFPTQYHEELQRRLLLERQRFDKAMTVDQLNEVADTLTLYVRSLGYSFHTVKLPPQQVSGGVVYLLLHHGVLGDVQIQNRSKLPDRRLLPQFSGLLSQPLYAPNVEARVKAIQASGGVRLFPFYSRGDRPGEVRLNLKVDPAERNRIVASYDNHGSDASGETRLILQYTRLQATYRHDRLNLALLQTMDGVDNQYGSLQYSRRFADLSWAWDASLSNNDFELGDRFKGLGLEGNVKTLAAGISRAKSKGQFTSSNTRLSVYNKESELLGASQEEQSQAILLSLSRSYQNQQRRSSSKISFDLTYGQFDVVDVAQDNFAKVQLSASWNRYLGQRRRTNRLGVVVKAQASDVALPSIEGLSLSGVSAVRGLESGTFSADSGLVSSVEWGLPGLGSTAARKWTLEPFLFWDFAAGYKQGLGEVTKRHAQFNGGGMGLRMAWGRHLSAELLATGKAKGRKGKAEVENDERILFEIRWQ